MDEILHHFKTMVETIVSWYLQGHLHSRVAWVVRNRFRPSTVVRVRPGVPAKGGAGGTEAGGGAAQTKAAAAAPGRVGQQEAKDEMSCVLVTPSRPVPEFFSLLVFSGRFHLNH